MYLNCHSYHSLRYGTIPLAELIALGVEKGARAMALTDVNTVTGIYDFIKECQKVNIKPLVGIEFRSGDRLLYIGLAKNAKGLSSLCEYLTKYNLERGHLPQFAPCLTDVFIIYSLDNCPAIIAENEYIGIRPTELSRLLQPKWSKFKERMVILQPVTIRNKDEYNLHRILRAVDTNVILSKLDSGNYCKDEVFISQDRLLSHFNEYPQIVRNTERIVEDCNFTFDFNTPKNKRFYTNSRYADKQLLESLALDGLKRRYSATDKKALARVKHELEVIDNMGFSGYFLINWDIIRYSNSKGFLHVGRGSGANSIVSYCLGITDICPIELNLYFERFLNPGRTSAPDFDIDWSWRDRDTIINYVYKRFGERHVAFCGTIGEFKYRSTLRELGKVFGLSKNEIDALVAGKVINPNDGEISRAIYKYGKMLERFPNSRSIHSCGMLISEEPITNYTALEIKPKEFPIAQFDMHIAEDIGFDKFDILSQRGIGVINDAVRLIEQNRGVHVDIRNTKLSKNEAQCNENLKKGKTLGCFYIESPAMRGLLRKLHCDSYKVLVAASSVIRPGVAQSGMMTEYVFRHNNPDKFEYFHPVFEEQLGETYGVMVYQEDVIKIAHHFAGLDLSDADILRRAMSGKTRSRKEFEGVMQKYFDNCKAKGYPEQLTKEVYRQIESFAGYSFCKAHSASYAVESYQSLYLKVYYPIEFFTAVINNFGGFYRTEIYVHGARMAGAIICNPCVNKSGYEAAVYGNEIYLGFVHIKSLEAGLSQSIVSERERSGEYKSLGDFVNRVNVQIEMLQGLIFVGAFRFTGKSKNELILEARMLLVNFKPENRGLTLLDEPVKEYKLPTLMRDPFEDAFDEIELLGFPVSCSPFDLLQTKWRGDVMAAELMNMDGATVRMLGYLVCIKENPTKNGMMNFGTWLDLNGDYFDTAHFAQCLKCYPFKGGGCYIISARVQVDFGFPTLIVQKMDRLPFIADPRYANDDSIKYRIHNKIQGDYSATHRAPYPTNAEIGLPRSKMAASYENKSGANSG